ELRHDARVGAGDEHGPRILRRGQRLEEFHLLGEHLFAETPETADNAVQGFLGAFAAGAHLDRNGVVLVRHCENLGSRTNFALQDAKPTTESHSRRRHRLHYTLDAWLATAQPQFCYAN